MLFGWRGISGRADSGGNVTVVVVVGGRMGRTARYGTGVGIGMGRSTVVATGGKTTPGGGFGVTVW